jgi:hypothetical protein
MNGAVLMVSFAMGLSSGTTEHGSCVYLQQSTRRGDIVMFDVVYSQKCHLILL